jgi:RimJ/RimL family protein N-acetyltransferase
MEGLMLLGSHVRLEPLERRHADGLAAASAADPALYRWTFVPQGILEAANYIESALTARDTGSTVPFAIVRVEDGSVIGSTRFFNLEQWPWPAGHARHGRQYPDVCEIGYTWLTRPAIRTGANTEAKRLMLAHAFDTWKVLRVSLHTDARNLRSRAAIERIGGRSEGILRAHRMSTDYTARDSARFSILAEEWPELKRRLFEIT